MILILLVGISIAATLIFIALGQNVSYFRTPSEVLAGAYPEKVSGRPIRLGGLVEKGSLRQVGSGISFRVTDLKRSLPVSYQGMTPDLFREGQGVIAEGQMGADGEFKAKTLLAKHDEKYMPPEVAQELKDAPSKP